MNVYRPSYITGHSFHGICNEGSLDRMIRASLKVGMFPRLSSEFVDLIPVDFCSRGIF